MSSRSAGDKPEFTNTSHLVPISLRSHGSGGGPEGCVLHQLHSAFPAGWSRNAANELVDGVGLGSEATLKIDKTACCAHVLSSHLSTDWLRASPSPSNTCLIIPHNSAHQTIPGEHYNPSKTGARGDSGSLLC